MPSRRFLTSCWTLFTDLLNLYLYKLHQLKGPLAVSTPTSAYPPYCQGKNTCGTVRTRRDFHQLSLPKSEGTALKGKFFILLYSIRAVEIEWRKSRVDSFFLCLKQLQFDFIFSASLSSLGTLSPSSCFLGQSLPINTFSELQILLSI